MTEKELNQIEEQLYSEQNYDNENLAEWARRVIPMLIKELREYVNDDPDYSQ